MINVKKSSVKYPLFLSDFNDSWTFSTGFLKNQILSFIKICPVGGRTDMMKLIVAFINFGNTPKMFVQYCMFELPIGIEILDGRRKEGRKEFFFQ